jgi:rfaE bifunctional protein nucleotidyltransferase chain/domain
MKSSFTISELLVLRSKWASEGEKVVFTNGVFDILHVGHLHSIESAKSYGTRIIIGINSDSSVRKLGKGPNRPVNNDTDRAKLLSSLTCVDAVVIFSENTPLELISALSPDILIKGGDYDPTCEDRSHSTYIVGSYEVRRAGGSVHTVPLLPGHSTTEIINKK